jgi:hypothetical protein
MKAIISLLLFAVVSFGATAQKIDFKDDLEEAVKSAIKKNKSIFIFIEAPSTKTDQFAWAADAEIAKIITENFIPFKTTFRSTDAIELIKKYPFLNKYPAYVFLHNNRELFFNDFGNSTGRQKYLKVFNDALNASTQKKLSDYEADYNSKKDSESLKAFIMARQKQGITNNAILIETYVSLLTSENFNDYKTVLFILRAGPFVDGKAYKLAYTNRKIIDSIYKFESLQIRSDINRNILINTMNNAKDTKNIIQAQAAANFVRRTSGSSTPTAIKNYSGQMLNYFIAVNDTTKYLRSAVDYFDRYYMNLSADSIKKLEAVQSQNVLERSKPVNKPSTLSQAQIDSLKASPNTIVRRESFTTTVPSMRNSYANALNGAAYKFYETGTTNINYLTKAMIWSRRSIELKPEASYYDTLAHILYRLGYKAEAIKTQETAINKAKIDGRPYENMQEELRKFKSK